MPIAGGIKLRIPPIIFVATDSKKKNNKTWGTGNFEVEELQEEAFLHCKFYDYKK